MRADAEALSRPSPVSATALYVACPLGDESSIEGAGRVVLRPLAARVLLVTWGEAVGWRS